MQHTFKNNDMVADSTLRVGLVVMTLEDGAIVEFINGDLSVYHNQDLKLVEAA